MENIHLIFKFLWYSILFCIWGVSCTSSGTYKKTQMDIYMQYYDFIIDSLSKNPNYVCTRTARQMSFTTDSVAYCHYLVLLAKAYMFKSEMDSAKLSMDRAEVFCDGAEPSPLINDLYAEIYNMRGNVCVRQGLTDSSVVCFQKAFDYRLKVVTEICFMIFLLIWLMLLSVPVIMIKVRCGIVKLCLTVIH